MNFEPQCKEQADLYEQMARVLRMCKEAGFNRPWDCAKYEGDVVGGFASFDRNPKLYEFALAIVEGRPVFRGDVLYFDKGMQFEVIGWNEGLGSLQARTDGLKASYTPNRCRWNLPKPKTITVNGMEVNAPVAIEPARRVKHGENRCVLVECETSADAEAFKAALEGKK